MLDVHMLFAGMRQLQFLYLGTYSFTLMQPADMKKLCTVIATMLMIYSVTAQSSKPKLLFTQSDRSSWYTFLEKSGKNADPLKVFQFENNVLHVSGQEFGYVITEESYASFHLSLEFKWGVKKFPPRENEKRDAGVLYNAHLYSGDKIWPRSLEFQIQEGDCGDFWLTDSVSMTHADTVTPKTRWFRVVKTKDTEKPNGEWNKVEVIIQDGKITHKMNGEVVNTGADPSVKSGRIVLQSEGAEIFYRNVQLVEL